MAPAPKLKPTATPTAAGAAIAALQPKLAQRITASLLPGDEPFTAEGLAEAARFVCEAGFVRKPEEPAIAIQTASDGRRFMRVAIVNDDMPFLVDSVAACIAGFSLPIDRLVHPVVAVRRDAAGQLTALPEGDCAGEKRESLIYLETARVDAKQRRAIEQALALALADVRAAVADWPQMRQLIAEDADRVSDAEGAALLRWMGAGNLTQLGHVTRRRDGSQAGNLGICRKSTREVLADSTFERAFAWFEGAGPGGQGRSPLVVKANRLSLVHRRVPLDLFIVPLTENGRVEALSIHAGIWTSAALLTPPESVPRLRSQLATLMERFGFDPTGHDGKKLTHSLTALPHDIVISFGDGEVARVATTMMALVDRPRPRLVMVEAPLKRHLYAFVWLPRDLVATQVRMQIQALLSDGTGGQVLDWSLAVEGGSLAVLRFVLDIREGESAKRSEQELDDELQALLRGWPEAVENELAKSEEPARAAALAMRYAECFPTSYRAAYSPAEAARDIQRLRALAAAEPPAPLGRDVRLFRLAGDPPSRLRLKVCQLGGAMALSDAVPALEHFGFRVQAEIPSSLDGGTLGTIHDFTLTLPEGDDGARLLERAGEIEAAIDAVLNGAAEDDVFNRLIIGNGLAAGDANLLRAFYRYLRQAGMGYTIYTVCDALARSQAVTSGLLALFDAMHDPAFKGDRAAAIAEAESAIRDGLAQVSAINDDRLLRLYRDAFRAILRTNFFAPAAEEALAFKFDSALVPGLPKPVPWREIFVYSRRVEGIHLRAGPIARGGLRWSDRRDDFRTEILGLMKAQRVKNAVIVPTGAKGGFYPKQLPDMRKDRDAWAAEGRASYQIFIRSLLSVTDNLVQDKVAHPPKVVIRDGDDPYFVVAADKGTATFSDVANAIAESRDFWLDDAFASGGSHGYDHKAMGITARGAWLSVQRHFLEMGIDVQTESVRVAGCGDMSGDVFGNGMLLSRAIKLVAAFDHRHIFIDPAPDPAKSWAERKRLFDLPRSSWDDYDRKLISKGGGIFPRSLKSISLTPEMRAVLGTDAEELDPDALISVILKAPVDLIWFGGIGTYVKSAAENNATVGDPANDALRIDARELRARVIGEGANLGCTQAGRIEFSLKGGRVNTDFIDNSAGVDCSDNEVNIKIALAAARRTGKLSERRRNELLVEMTDEVAEIVLEDNRLQALGLSIAELGGASRTASYLRLIDLLEEQGGLDRETEGLADNETLSRRAGDNQGLTRPELAVLLSSSKLALQDAIERSTLPDDEALVATLLDAFPQPLQDKFRPQLLAHRLRREIIATKLANRIVNRMGLIHPFELAEEEGATLHQIAAAFVCAEQLFGMAEIWDRIERADMPEPARLLLFDRAALALRNHMADSLRAGADLDPPAKFEGELSGAIHELSSNAQRLLQAEARFHSDRLRAELADAGVPQAEAALVAHLFDMDGAIGLARLSVQTKLDAVGITEAFTALGARLGLDWAQGTAATMNPSDPWERLLVAGLARDFQQMRFDLLRRLARRKDKGQQLAAAVEAWSELHGATIAKFRAMITRAQGAGPVAPAVLAQIASQARNLLAR